MKVYVRNDDGSEVDITEGVQVLYDSLTSSMDWGSGFLDFEEVSAIRSLGYACGFESIEYQYDSCRECGHFVTDHRADGRRCRHGWRTHLEHYWLDDAGRWALVVDRFGRPARPPYGSEYDLPVNSSRRRTETVVDEVGCSCDEYAPPMPAAPSAG